MATQALAELKTTDELPNSQRPRKSHGHDILALTDAVVDRVAIQRAYIRRPAVQEDLDFIRNDLQLRQMLSVLATFGKGSRCYRLEEFLKPDGVAPGDDPDRAWEAIEMEILRGHPDWIQQLDPKAPPVVLAFPSDSSQDHRLGTRTPDRPFRSRFWRGRTTGGGRVRETGRAAGTPPPDGVTVG